MRNALRLTLAALLLTATAGAPAFAADEMKKDSMSKEEPQHDSMKKDDAHHGSMMKQDSMKKDDLKK